MIQKDVNGMTNSVDPDQTAPREEVWSGSTLFVCPGLSVWKLKIVVVFFAYTVTVFNFLTIYAQKPR